MNTHPGLLSLCTIPREAQDCGPCFTYSQTPHFPIFRSCLCCFCVIIPFSPANFHCSNSTHLPVPSQKHFRRTLQIHGKSFFLIALISPPLNFLVFPGVSVVKKKSTCQYRRFRRHGFNSWIRKTLWRRKWQPTPVLLPGVSHGQRRLVGYSP